MRFYRISETPPRRNCGLSPFACANNPPNNPPCRASATKSESAARQEWSWSNWARAARSGQYGQADDAGPYCPDLAALTQLLQLHSCRAADSDLVAEARHGGLFGG